MNTAIHIRLIDVDDAQEIKAMFSHNSTRTWARYRRNLRVESVKMTPVRELVQHLEVKTS